MTITEHPNNHANPQHETTVRTDVAVTEHTVVTSQLPLGDGWVTFDTATGSPIQFTEAAHPERTYLLDTDVPWHSVEHAWGSGHIIANGLAGRWNAPESMWHDADTIGADYSIDGRVSVHVERQGGDVLRETYRFRNTTNEPLQITSLGIQVPFADLYEGALDALQRRVHAHVFTGGSWAWVAAQPMSGGGRVLGLRVTQGELAGYSIETRNSNTLSNARGHIVLHVTDHARNPDAFGGQPIISLAPGAEYTLEWQLAWYADVSAFLSEADAPARFTTLAATVGDVITVHTEHTLRGEEGLQLNSEGSQTTVSAAHAGLYSIQIGETARTEILFHDTVEETVRRRSAYVLTHQLSQERPGLLAHAIVPVDTRTGLTQLTNGWSDWTDGSERIGVALMLQHGLQRGWLDPSVDETLNNWADFAREHLIDASAAPRRGSQDHHSGIRLYDTPWLARFFLLRFGYHRRGEDLDMAARLLERGLELGMAHFLTIGFSEIAVAVADALEQEGDKPRASSLRDAVIESARHFVHQGEALPDHEVSYEQAIVAPLLNLLIDAHRLTGDPELLKAIESRLPWLLAFGGPQPHARMHGIALRHWDGFWFGQRRQWGDIFPHYWSALTATVLLRLPAELSSEAIRTLADSILRANMVNYFADGSATCAFVMPTSVDGVAAHAADPLANDQDFHLALWMQLETDGFTTLP